MKEYLPDVLRSVEELPLARKVCGAILSLLDDVHAGFVRKVKTIGGQDRILADMGKFTLTYPIVWATVLKPCVDHLYGAFMIGCLPLCFQPIRISVEAMTISYCIDRDHYRIDEVNSFTRLDEFNRKLRAEKSIAKFLKEDFASVIDDMDVGKRALTLWGKVSEDFMHFAGLNKKLEYWSISIDDYSPPPSWAVGAFIPYDISDEPQLQELEICVKELNKLFIEVTDAWIKNCLKGLG